MSDTLTIQSHKGPYTVYFDDGALDELNLDVPDNAHFIIDANIAELYGERMCQILGSPSVLLLDASEYSKSIDKFPQYIDHLVGKKIRRDQLLIGIGGGIIQDITCFLAASMLRGVNWRFYPTTLLSQADSCIGSKSSINSGSAKNILGTFTPPNEVFISTDFLDSLDERDVRSGMGEILKFHVIDGPDSFNKLAADYPRLFNDKELMMGYIRKALAIKVPFIEEDEFDRGIRNIFNYGHSFGHAIEAATDFAVPHGIAVTMGMDMANFAAANLGVANGDTYQRMHPTLKANFRNYENVDVPIEPFIDAISKDKKNSSAESITLILPDAASRLKKSRHPNDSGFKNICVSYFDSGRKGLLAES